MTSMWQLYLCILVIVAAGGSAKGFPALKKELSAGQPQYSAPVAWVCLNLLIYSKTLHTCAHYKVPAQSIYAIEHYMLHA